MADHIEEYLCQIKDDPDIRQWDTLYTHLDAKEPILMSVRLQDERGGRGELDVENVVAQERRLIISGASGMGKTTTLKWLTLVYAENYPEGAERPVPLYVDLGRFKRGMFYDHALMIAHENGLEEEDFKELLDDGKLVIFLDGLDLLGGSEDLEPVAEIQNFISEFSWCKFVLSSRPGFFEGFKSSCKVSELVELDDPKIKGYIHKYLGEGDKADTLINRIFDSRNERLKLLCKNPMMLHLVIWLQENDKIADDRAGIYRESVEGIITHYREKGKTLSSNEQLVRDVLKELAFSMQKENTVRLDYGDALDAAGSCISPERYRRVSTEQILKDCFGLGLLHKDGDEVRFGFHQSFQEYFAAVKLKEIFEYGYDISESFSHPKWEDVLVFLSEITKRPDELIDDVVVAGEIFLAAKLTANADDRRVENLCALLLNKVDSRFDLEKAMAVKFFLHIGDRAIDALMELHNSEDVGLVHKAACTRGMIGDERAIEPLIDSLHDNDPMVRIEAAWILGGIRNERVIEPLRDALQNDEYPLVLKVAARALEMIGDEKTAGILIDALRSDDPVVRIDAAWALGMIRNKEAVEPLIDALHDDNPKVRGAATRALRMIEDERAVEPLINALHDNDLMVRNGAVQALGTILNGKEAVKPHINALLHDDDPKVRIGAARELGKLGDEKAVELLIDALDDDDLNVLAVGVLGELGDERAIKPLINKLDDGDPNVRKEVAWALGKIRSEKAVEPLINTLYDDDPSVRRGAARALGRIGDEKAVEPLIVALDDDDLNVRLMAAYELGEIGDNRAVEPLIDALHDDISFVQSRAAEALKPLCEPKHKGKLEPLLKSDRKDVVSAAFEILHSIELKEREKIKIFRELKEKTTHTKVKSGYTTSSGVIDAGEMLADAHLGALVDRLKLVPDSITIVDYGCGKGAFLGRMKEIERELGKIHYIGVDISRGNRYLAGITAKRCGVTDKLKSYNFMNPDEFFRKNIDIGHVFFSHVIHEIFLKDLPEILYHLLSKMKAGSRITILEQVILVEPERDFVTWDVDDFDMLFSGFAESSPRPYQTGRGHELISVDLERLDTDVDLESMYERCLEVYRHMKKRVLEKLRSPDLSDDKHRNQTALLANIDSQIADAVM